MLDALAGSTNPSAAIAGVPPPPGGVDEWGTFSTTFRTLCAQSPGWPSEIETVTRWYEPHLFARYENPDIRLGDLRQLAAIAAGYSSRERFLTELTLDPPSATSDEAGVPILDEDYLVLSTIHSAKGQEWRAVYVLSTVDGCIPSDMATGSTSQIEEERRLLYVAMTRAKDHLTVVIPQRFYTHQQSSSGDRHVYATRSRFIPDALISNFDLTSWPLTQENATPSAVRAIIDLAARMRGAWT